jgi:hypothetical protein
MSSKSHVFARRTVHGRVRHDHSWNLFLTKELIGFDAALPTTEVIALLLAIPNLFPTM